MKKALALAGVISFAVFAAACTPEQRCKFAETTYHNTKDRGGAAERKIADAVYAETKARCAAQGIIIN